MKSAGILAPILLLFRLLGLERGSLSGLGRSDLLFRLVKLRCGYEYRQFGQLLLGRLISGRDEHLGIEVGVGISRDFLNIKRVLVAVVGDDVNVGRAVREFRLDADEATGNVAAVEDPVHRISGKYVGDFLFRGKLNQSRLQERRPDHRGSRALGYHDGARRIRLQAFRGRLRMSGGRSGEGKANRYGDGDERFHGQSFRATRPRRG